MYLSKNIRLLQKDNIELIVLGALFTFPLIKLSLISVLVGLLGIYVLTFNRKLFITNLKDFRILKSFLGVSLWVLFYWLTFFYSEDKERALTLILRTIPLLLVPFFMFYGIKTLAYDKLRNLMCWFSIVSLLFLTRSYILVVNALNHFKFNNRLNAWNIIENFKEFSIYTAYDLIDFVRWAPFEHNLELHRTYFSLFFMFCGIFWMYDFFVEKKIFKLILALLFFVFVIYFGSIPNIVALSIILLLIFIKKVRLIYVIGGFFALFILLTIVINKSTYLSNQLDRTKTFTHSVLDYNNNPTIDRIRYLDVFLELYKKNPLLGYGVGDVENELLKVYKNRAYEIEYNEKKNVHNYYFHLLLVGGIPLLLLFLWAIYYFTKEAIIRRNYLLLYIIIVFGINFFSENILVRIHGVFMFSLFLCILGKLPHNSNLEE